MPSVLPSLLPFRVDFEPLLAHEASYLAASERIDNLVAKSVPTVVPLTSVQKVFPIQQMIGAKLETALESRTTEGALSMVYLRCTDV